MFYKKKGKPEEGEILICTVKRILPHAVFANIDEYEHAEGMIHISEIAPGRIRNLRDYVIEGKRIVCKVINVNKQGNIDLSLRRVPTSLMVSKLNYYKQEEKAEKLVEQIGKEASYDIKKFYEEIGYKIIEKHGSLYEFFNEVVRKGKAIVDELKPSQKFGDALFKTIKEKIKLPEVTLSYELVLKTYKEDGIENIKQILTGNKCGKYSLKKICECGGEFINPKPAKYSKEDKYAKYRLEYKRKSQNI